MTITQSERTISFYEKSRYRSCFFELADFIERAGFTLEVTRSTNRHDVFPKGAVSPELRRVSLILPLMPAAETEVLAVLAHEVRHIEHMKTGAFHDYYDESKRDTVAAILAGAEAPEAHSPYCELTAYLAENDCNFYAREFLIKSGYDKEEVPSFLDHYDHRHTTAYAQNRMVEKHAQKIQDNNKRKGAKTTRYQEEKLVSTRDCANGCKEAEMSAA